MDCDAAHNRIGIRVQGGCASRCHVNSNSVAGIHATNATVQGNTVSGNGSSSSGLEGQGGIWALSGSRIEDNHCRDNKRGIFARDFDGCIIRRNTCDGNETNWDIRAGNAVAPIVVTTNNAAPILGNSYAGDLGSTDPHANFTY
jgi:parallel beta-helix repeat protein